MMGFFVKGLFLGMDSVQRVEEEKIVTTYFVGVAVGTDAYRIYLAPGQENDASAFSMGDEIVIRVRPFAGKRGVGFSDGVIGK